MSNTNAPSVDQPQQVRFAAGVTGGTTTAAATESMLIPQRRMSFTQRLIGNVGSWISGSNKPDGEQHMYNRSMSTREESPPTIDLSAALALDPHGHGHGHSSALVSDEPNTGGYRQRSKSVGAQFYNVDKRDAIISGPVF